ncbi:MAG: cytochrome c5 family protein [Chlorobiaceae bacterium]|nr:cytochrome c5 family protein [Chlorobiaceae bacterium]
MTIKFFLPLLTFTLFFLGACSPEKSAETEEVTESREEKLTEMKLGAGKVVYEANCAGCHDAGVAGAPKPGDKPAWIKRMGAGLEAMTKKSIEGFEGESGVMPPKGGNAILTDEEVTNAVTYMASKSK